MASAYVVSGDPGSPLASLWNSARIIFLRSASYNWGPENLPSKILRSSDANFSALISFALICSMTNFSLVVNSREFFPCRLHSSAIRAWGPAAIKLSVAFCRTLKASDSRSKMY